MGGAGRLGLRITSSLGVAVVERGSCRRSTSPPGMITLIVCPSAPCVRISSVKSALRYSSKLRSCGSLLAPGQGRDRNCSPSWSRRPVPLSRELEHLGEGGVGDRDDRAAGARGVPGLAANASRGLTIGGRLPSGFVNTEACAHERDWYLEHLPADVDRFAGRCGGPLDDRSAGCPGWDLRHLTAHMGVVHRWARHCAANAAPPKSREYQPDPELDAGELADWLVSGGEDLVGVLRTIDLDGPTWHPFPVPKLGLAAPPRPTRPRSTAGTPSMPGSTTPIDPELPATGSTSTSTW